MEASDSLDLSNYRDWQHFFHRKLTRGGHFLLKEFKTKGDTDIEIYQQQIGDHRTTIEIGYLAKKTLIYIHLFNPDTPGYNRQQMVEYFYKYQFSNEKDYGDPGLDFDTRNLEPINKFLINGPSGKEILYFKDGKLVKSNLSLEHDGFRSEEYNHVFHFDNGNFLSRIWKKLFNVRNNYTIKEVSLQSVFSGIKS